MLGRGFYVQLACCTAVFLGLRSYCVAVCAQRECAITTVRQQLDSARRKIARWDGGSTKWSVALQQLLFVQRLVKKSGGKICSGSVRRVAANRWAIVADLSVDTESVAVLLGRLQCVPYGVMLCRKVRARRRGEVVDVSVHLEWVVVISESREEC